jgi:hypothetical protein
MAPTEWWVYAGIVAWSVALDSAGLLAASNTWRFVLVATGLVFLTMRAIAALAAGLLLPTVLSERLGLGDHPEVLIFIAPIVSLAVIEVFVGRITETGASRVDFTSLMGNLRALATADARAMADEARYRGDLRLIALLAQKYPSADLEESLVNLLHTKLPALKDAKERAKALLDAASADESARRPEVATEIVKIDRTFATNLAKRKPLAGEVLAEPAER